MLAHIYRMCKSSGTEVRRTPTENDETRRVARRRQTPGEDGSEKAAIEQIAAFIEYVSRLALSDRVQQRLAGATRAVTQSELGALRAVDRQGPLTFGDLADRLGLDRTTVSRLAASLQEQGLITRESDEHDKRKAWLAVTPAGRALLDGLNGVSRQYYEVATSEWTPEERAAAGDMLDRLRHDLLRLQFDEVGRASHLDPGDAQKSA
jgi:DNA-binding MarR family transcriptional regulator